MTYSRTPGKILVILAVVMLIKSVWGLAHPSSLKGFGSWWSKAVLQVNTFCAFFCLVLAAVLWIVVLIGQPLTNWLLVACGALCAWTGVVFLKPGGAEKLVRRMLADRGTGFIRIVSLVSAVVAVFLLYVAVKAI